MKIDLVSLFPEVYKEYINSSILKRATGKNLLEINTHNLRDYSTSKSRRVDGAPVGGGPGLIISPVVVDNALKALSTEKTFKIATSPRGVLLSKELALEIAEYEHVLIVAGHYEGIDERALDQFDILISIGDYVLTGGELPSLVIVDCLSRFISGVISKDSLNIESHDRKLLEYPQYTLPRVYNGIEVPEILFSGNHQLIDDYHLYESLALTRKRRLDLYNQFLFTSEDIKALKRYESYLIKQKKETKDE